MNVVERFEHVVPIDNPSGGEDRIREYIMDALREMGISELLVDVGGNLLARIPGAADQPMLMFSAHMDSVPPCHGIAPIRDIRQEQPIIRSAGRTILGADDKSGIAVALTLVERLAKSGFEKNHPLELLFSTGEEVGLTGMKQFDMQQVRSSFAYVLDGEGRCGLIFNAGPSQENIRILCHGKAAHAGMSPEEGINAVQMGASICAQIPSGRLAEDLTCNIGVVQSGLAMNIVPPEFALRGEMRSHDESKLQALLTEYADICQSVEKQYQQPSGSVEFIHERRYEHFYVPQETPVIQRAWQVAETLGLKPQLAPMNIGSDAHILNLKGLDTVVLGMGFHYSHSLGEFIFCKELESVFEMAYQLALF